MKTVYWKIERIEGVRATVTFWTKQDRSNALQIKVKATSKEQDLRDAIEKVILTTNFKLEGSYE
jgi:hypothetical protein